MKEGWEIKRLGDICKIQTGKLDANAKVDDGEYPFFTCDSKPYKIDKYAFDDEAILISGNGSLVGHVNYYKGKFNAYQRTYVLTQFNSYHLPFLIIYLKGYLRPYIIENKKGGCIPYITLPILQNFQIPLPSFAEQEKIVAELDCLSGIIEKKKQQLKEYDALAQSIFYEMFDKSSEFVALSFYIDSLSAGKSLAGDEECPNKVLKTGAVTYDYFDSKQVKNLPLEYIPIQNHKVNVKDVLISRMNTAELVGACAYVRNVDDSTYLPDRLWRAELKNNSNPIYIWKAITTEKSKEQIRNYASGTSGSMKNISKSSFLKVQIPKVDLSLQQAFASKIEAIEKQKELIKKSIEEVETLFNSRMDYYFN